MTVVPKRKADFNAALDVELTRGNELRDLWKRLGSQPELRRQLEELWPEMEGRWMADFGPPRKTDESAARLARITAKVKEPDDPAAARKEALDRVMKKKGGL
jgi:hypothetical protein